ncbi:membrane integrity-associated transporter subunit PqiC [Acidocella sp.]|uniref:PqiC family protein n=1 Tax=Acidocella sp. TaxID=50710 RepID=UPI00260262D7|nr:PqiC family protein [Acidocella sp.]
MRRRFLLASPLALAACSSPVVHEYRLAAVPGSVRGGSGLRIVVRDIGLAGELAQPGLPRPGGPYTADSFANDVWASPLPDLLQEAMVQNLAQRLPGDIVLAGNSAIGVTPDIYVEINVLAFTPDATGNITLQAQLSTRHGQAAAKDWQLRNFTASAPGGMLPAAIAAAMSTLWGQAADIVACMI